MLKKLQKEQKVWVKHNFGDRGIHQPLLGVTEELGELSESDQESKDHVFEIMKSLGRLSHAHLKKEQGIRNNENHDENARDAVADIVIYLSDYCSAKGFDFEITVQETWDQVKRRDWKKDGDNGFNSK